MARTTKADRLAKATPEQIARFERLAQNAERAREDAARREKHYAEVAAIVATGKCPTCGAKLRRNLSLTGWWQCEQLGADTHRADATKPSCDWQGFTK